MYVKYLNNTWKVTDFIRIGSNIMRSIVEQKLCYVNSIILIENNFVNSQ